MKKKKLQKKSMEITPGIFDFSTNNQDKLLNDINADFSKFEFEKCARNLAYQFNVNDMLHTPFYDEAKGIHYRPRDPLVWIANSKKALINWLVELKNNSKIVDVQTGQSKMKLLELHCPSLPGCETAFRSSTEYTEGASFKVEVLGFGSGSKNEVIFIDTIRLYAKETCIEAWVPVEYEVRHHQVVGPKSRGYESIFYTVNPTNIGDDMDVKESECDNNECVAIPSSLRSEACYELSKGAEIERGVKYNSHSTTNTRIGVKLPMGVEVGLTATVSFNYTTEYIFKLRGPGKFDAYKISRLLPETKFGINSLEVKKTFENMLGYTWKWMQLH